MTAQLQESHWHYVNHGICVFLLCVPPRCGPQLRMNKQPNNVEGNNASTQHLLQCCAATVIISCSLSSSGPSSPGLVARPSWSCLLRARRSACAFASFASWHFVRQRAEKYATRSIEATVRICASKTSWLTSALLRTRHVFQNACFPPVFRGFPAASLLWPQIQQ